MQFAKIANGIYLKENVSIMHAQKSKATIVTNC